MKIHSLLSCLVLFSLLFFTGCPPTSQQAPPSSVAVEADSPASLETLADILDTSGTLIIDSSFAEMPVAESVSAVTPEPPVTLGLPVTPATDPVPVTPAPPQETPEEQVVRERAAVLGGSIRKNAEGRIDRVIIANNDLTLADAKAIGKLTSLEWIRMAGPSITDEYVEALSDLPNLKIVDISNSIITDKSLEMLKTRTGIHTLELQRNLQLSDNAIKLFAEFPNLQTLKILYNGFSSASLYNLDSLKSVRILDLRGLPVGDDTLMFLADLENLEEIRIRSISVSNEGLAELAKSPKLKTIELQDTSISPGSAESFKEMKSLRSLRIFRGSKFTAEAVEELGILTNLTTLELREVGCNNEALLALKPLTQLKIVEFSELTVDSATMVEVLKSYPKLESIRIFAIPVDDTVASLLATVPTLKSVSLPATAITDKGLEALSVLSDLTLLDIHGNEARLTVQGSASALGNFKNLRRIIMPGTLNTPAVRSAILEGSPRCQIDTKVYSQGT